MFSTNPSLTRRGFLKRGCAGLGALAVLSEPKIADAVSAPDTPSGALVLDNSDPWFRGKVGGKNNLALFLPSGKLHWRISGLNICEEIGSPHRIAVDPLRKRIWLTETVDY